MRGTIKDIDLWSAAWPSTGDNIEYAIVVKVIDGDRDATGKGGVIREEGEQEFKSGPIEDLDLRSAAGSWSGDDVVDAIVVKISGGDKDAAGEVGIVGEEVGNAVAGLPIKDLDMWPAACPRSGNDVAAGARVIAESDANFAVEAGVGSESFGKGTLRVAVKVDLGTRDRIFGAGGEGARGDEGVYGESTGFPREAECVADVVTMSGIGGVNAAVNGEVLYAAEFGVVPAEGGIVDGEPRGFTGTIRDAENSVLIGLGIRFGGRSTGGSCNSPIGIGYDGIDNGDGAVIVENTATQALAAGGTAAPDGLVACKL